MAMHHVHAVPVEARKEHQILSDWSYKQSLATILVLEMEPGSSVKAANAFNHSFWPYLMTVLAFRVGEASRLLN